MWSYHHNLLRIQCTGSGPSVPSTRDLTLCCLVRRGALWLLIRTEVLASGLRHAHHPVLHAHYAVHWRRQSLGFDELCLSQSDLFNHLFHVVGRDLQYLQFSITKANGHFPRQSFKAVSLTRHIVTKHTVSSRLLKVSMDNPKWFKTDCVDFHSEHTCLDILLLYMFRLPPYEYNGHTQITE